MLGNGRYYVVQDWMLSELQLKGIDLTLYAIIWGFTQDGTSKFYGSISYLQKWTNVTPQTIMSSLQRLVNSKLLEKEEVTVKGSVKLCKYWCTDPISNLTDQSGNFVENNQLTEEISYDIDTEKDQDMTDNGSKNFTCTDEEISPVRIKNFDSYGSKNFTCTDQNFSPNNIVLKNKTKNINTNNIYNQNFSTKNFDENSFFPTTNFSTKNISTKTYEVNDVLGKDFKKEKMRKIGTAFTKLNDLESQEQTKQTKKVSKVKKPLPTRDEVFNSCTKLAGTDNSEGLAKKEAERIYKEQKQQIKAKMLQQDAFRLIDSMFTYDVLRDKLREYYEVRKDMKLKSRFSLVTWKAILEDLRQQKLTEDQSVAAVTQSIAGGWAQIYYQNKLKNKNSFDNLAGKVMDKAYVDMTDEEKKQYDADKAVDENGNPILF